MATEHQRKIWRRASKKYRSNPAVKERQRAAAKLYEATYKARRKELNAAYGKKFRARKAFLTLRWIKNNPERAKAIAAKRRAKIRGSTKFHSLEEWNRLKLLANNRCAYCSQERKLTRDHFIPLSRNGEDSIENIVPACQSCNSSKNDMGPEQTAQWMADRAIDQIKRSLI